MTSDPSAPAIALPVQSVTGAADQSRLGRRPLGLTSALWISALTPILGCAVSLTLPEPRSG
jgi:hypothetical protein